MTPSLSWRTGAAVAATLALGACTPQSQDDVLPGQFIDPPAISAEATAAYGDRAAQAYDELADFVIEQATPAALLDPAHGTPTEDELVDGIVDQMTPETAAEWRATVAADLAGDTAARDIVRLLRFHTWEGSGYAAPRSGAVLRSQSVTDGTVALTTGTAAQGLQVGLTHDTRVQLTKDGNPIDVRLVRPLTFTLTAEGDGWLISAFEGTLTIPTST